jgi:formate dehydrogenase subunit delta
MDVQNLIKMANRIGDFFEAMPDHDEAIDGIGNHISKFWEKRMRREIINYVESGGTDLHPLVVEAIQKHVTAPAA